MFELLDQMFNRKSKIADLILEALKLFRGICSNKIKVFVQLTCQLSGSNEVTDTKAKTHFARRCFRRGNADNTEHIVKKFGESIPCTMPLALVLTRSCRSRLSIG